MVNSPARLVDGGLPSFGFDQVDVTDHLCGIALGRISSLKVVSAFSMMSLVLGIGLSGDGGAAASEIPELGRGAEEEGCRVGSREGYPGEEDGSKQEGGTDCPECFLALFCDFGFLECGVKLL